MEAEDNNVAKTSLDAGHATKITWLNAMTKFTTPIVVKTSTVTKKTEA